MNMTERWSKLCSINNTDGWEVFMADVQDEMALTDRIENITIDNLEHTKGYLSGLKWVLTYMNRIKSKQENENV